MDKSIGNEKRIKSAVPVYAAGAAAVLCALFVPLTSLLGYLVFAAIVVLCYISFEWMFPGKTIETAGADFSKTGRKDVDQALAGGKIFVEKMFALSGRIKDEAVRASLDKIISDARDIFDYVSKNPDSYGLIRSFANYYLPQAAKLTEAYIEFNSVGKAELDATIKNIESAMPGIADAFSAQLASLYSDKAFDIRTDIKVLEAALNDAGIKS